MHGIGVNCWIIDASNRCQAAVDQRCLSNAQWTFNIIINTCADKGAWLKVPCSTFQCKAAQWRKMRQKTLQCVNIILQYNTIEWDMYKYDTIDQYIGTYYVFIHKTMHWQIAFWHPYKYLRYIAVHTYSSRNTAHARWRHQMETLSALLTLCAGNSPVTGEFPSQRPVTRSFDGFF